MDNVIVKFKNAVKETRIQQKNFLAQAQYELDLIEKIVKRDKSINKYIDINIDSIVNEFAIFKTFGATYLFKQRIKKMPSIFDKKFFNKEKNKEITEDQFEHIIDEFKEFIITGKYLYSKTQSIINAFENDKIKEPINDLNDLISYIRIAPLNIEEISIILGMAIYFNNEYAKKNKNHKIINIELIQVLSNYYNKDGTFKYNEDIKTFRNTIKILLEENISEDNILSLILPTQIDLDELVDLLIENNLKIKNTTNNIKETTTIIPEEKTISEETKNALQELRKYYKNGTIVQIPENLDEFYKALELCGLDTYETKYIKELINTELEKQNKQQGLLNQQEQIIYEKALKLLNEFDYSNNDIYELKELIKELQDIFELSKLSTTKEDNEYLLNDVKIIISKLSIICNKYEKKEIIESTNRFIFLLDKDNTPYICNDIDSLDPSYRKLINALIEKINDNYQQTFKKVLHSEKLPYNLMTIYSPKAYVAFVEIYPNKYILIGTNVARNGYKEIINRLLSNQDAIKEIENGIKNPEKRNDILTNHEEYLTLLTTTNNQPLTKKKVKKN